MEASYTYHPATPDRKTDRMVVASEAEWVDVVGDLEDAAEWIVLNDATKAFIAELKGQGIRP